MTFDWEQKFRRMSENFSDSRAEERPNDVPRPLSSSCRNLDIPVLSQNLVSAKRRMKIVAGAADR
jgi:hypothetical protein